MAAMVFQPSEWHHGEDTMHRRLHVPDQPNPTVPYLPSTAAQFLTQCPIIALGHLTPAGEPYVSLLGGEPGFAFGMGDSTLAMKTDIGKQDPIVNWTSGLVAGLGIDLNRRKRIKFAGVVEDGHSRVEMEEGSAGGSVGVVIAVKEALGNCPKYLNKVTIRPSIPTSIVHSEGLPLHNDALEHIAKSGLFFVASRDGYESMDANHRGGPPGFLRVLSNNESDGAVVIWPEYSGNRLYQTLGNFISTPVAGITIPDFETGNVLYLTGAVEVLYDTDLLPRTQLAVKMAITSAKYVLDGLTMRGTLGEPSPYNPPVKYLRTERPPAYAPTVTPMTAKVLDVKTYTPSIYKLRLKLSSPSPHVGGQYIALDFSHELSAGYRHMDDSDPSGLNDDYVRTFTVSSEPERATDDEVEITFRKVGVVTGYMSNMTPRAGIEVPVVGIGGSFVMNLPENGGKVGYVAGGAGITPLLAQWDKVQGRVKVYWSVRQPDMPFVEDVIRTRDGFKEALQLFVTDGRELENKDGLSAESRRMQQEDVAMEQDGVGKVEGWYVCAGDGLKKSVLEWLKDDKVEYEDFKY